MDERDPSVMRVFIIRVRGVSTWCKHYIVVYGYACPCMAMYGYVRLCRDVYGYVWLCRAVYGYVCLCMAM